MPRLFANLSEEGEVSQLLCLMAFDPIAFGLPGFIPRYSQVYMCIL